jgi:hypothetical protein
MGLNYFSPSYRLSTPDLNHLIKEHGPFHEGMSYLFFRIFEGI